MLERLLDNTRKASLWLTWLGGGLIVFSAFLVTFEVFLRKIFNISLGGADEILLKLSSVKGTLWIFVKPLFGRRL